MFRKSVFGIALSLGLTASTTLAAGPLFEFRFNSLEDSAFTSSGTSAIEVYIKNPATKSDGLTGKRWDGALDNTGIERMGAAGGGAISRDRAKLHKAKSFTLMGWVRSADFTSQEEEARIFYWASSTGGLDVRTYKRQLRVALNGKLVGVIPLWNDKKDPNWWRFFAISWDGQQLRAYAADLGENSVTPIFSKETEGISEVTLPSVVFSIATAGGARSFKGALDNLRLFVSESDNGAALDVKEINEYLSRDSKVE